MKNKRGDILLGLLVGLGIGAAMLLINAGNEAQRQANISGMEVSPMEVIAEDPATSTLTVVGPAVAGAGVGWALDQLTDDGASSSRNNEINIDAAYGSVSVNISGDSQQDNDTSNEDNSRRP